MEGEGRRVQVDDRWEWRMGELVNREFVPKTRLRCAGRIIRKEETGGYRIEKAGTRKRE